MPVCHRGALISVGLSLVRPLHLVPLMHAVQFFSVAHSRSIVAAVRIELVNVSASHQNFSFG
jgi:hypothetical protein